MTPRDTVTPLALAVLALIQERPKHPYEIAGELRVRGRTGSVKLSIGSLYDTVQSLERREWLQPQETQRDGRRPERTVYAITERGRWELRRSLGTAVRNPAAEFPAFGGALAWLGLLGPTEVVGALRERAEQLGKRLQAETGGDAPAGADGLDQEFRAHMTRAELEWVTELARRIQDGEQDWPGEDVTRAVPEHVQARMAAEQQAQPEQPQPA